VALFFVMAKDNYFLPHGAGMIERVLGQIDFYRKWSNAEALSFRRRRNLSPACRQV